MRSFGITGHQTIPKEALSRINLDLTKVLSQFSTGLVGVTSLAAGADQLFAKKVLELGGKLNVVIPCNNYERTFSNLSDLECFLSLLNQAEEIETLDFAAPSEEAFLQAGYRVIDLSLMLIAIWDGRAAKGKGGTADIVDYARNHNIEVLIIWPPGVTR